MRKIESLEQREKALEWMVQTAQEVEHPLLSGEEKAKKMKLYNYVSQQVQDYNNILFAGKEYPPIKQLEKQPEPTQKQEVVSDWLDD